MFESIENLVSTWNDERKKTAKVLGALTDESLTHEVADGHRRLGPLAWHLTRSATSLLKSTGLDVEGPGVYGPALEEWAQYGMEPHE